MITAEKLLDCLENLPDDLIRETEMLRSKKPTHWLRWTALAACLCLCIGLWFALPGAQSADNAAGQGVPQENASPIYDKETSASTTGGLEATVFSVAEDHIVVTADQIKQYPGQDGGTVQLTVTFENLEDIPQFKPGQEIRIYYTEIDEEQQTVSPYRIEIINQQEVVQ